MMNYIYFHYHVLLVQLKESVEREEILRIKLEQVKHGKDQLMHIHSSIFLTFQK